MTKRILLFSLIIALAFAQLGCGSQKSAPQSENGQEETSSQEKVFLSIATGSPEGTVYVLGAGMATIIESEVPNVYATVETTAASVENAKLVGTGQSSMGFTGADVCYYAIKGEREFTEAYPDLRAMFGGYAMYMHLLVREDSGIKTFQDLKGKVVATGQPGSATSEVMVPMLLEANGVSMSDIKAHQLTWSDTAGALKDDTIDAGFIYSGLPNAATTDLTQTVDMRLIPMDDAVIENILKEHPYFFVETVKPGTYRGIDEEVKLLGVSVTTTVNANIPEDVVYKVAKAIFENNETMKQMHTEGAVYTPENVPKLASIPIHPGVVKYLKEIGIPVDD